MRKRRQRPGLKTYVRDIELQTLNTLVLAGRVPPCGLDRIHGSCRTNHACGMSL